MPIERSQVAVVGLGKIGLPLAVQYARHGKRVLGCDIDPQVVEMLNAGQSHIQEEAELATEVPRLVQQGLLTATTDIIEAVRQSAVVVIIVPVIVDAQFAVDFAGIDAATRAIGAGLQPGTLVVYETTVPVGSTSGRFAQILEDVSTLKAGQDFFLAYSPERVSSGSLFRDLRVYPKVVGGVNAPSTAAALSFYRSVLDAEMIEMASTDDAEFVKLIETTYRDVNIALANEFACFADARGLNVTPAIAAANTQPYSHIHTPGVGVGGHCIPVYPHFLLASLQGIQKTSAENMLLLPRMARRINSSMEEYAVARIKASIGSLTGRSVLILGVAYRGNVREIAFTSAQRLYDLLVLQDASIYVEDPLFNEQELRALGYTPLSEKQDQEISVILLQANHQVYQSLDFRRFPNCQVVLDGRHALKREHIEELGMRYIAIGDGQYVEDERGEERVSLVLQGRGCECD